MILQTLLIIAMSLEVTNYAYKTRGWGQKLSTNDEKITYLLLLNDSRVKIWIEKKKVPHGYNSHLLLI